MMDWGYMGSGGLAMAFGWMLGLLLLIGLVALVAALLGPRGQDRPAPPERTVMMTAAEAELELRYARGEIDASTLVETRAVLRQR